MTSEEVNVTIQTGVESGNMAQDPTENLPKPGDLRPVVVYGRDDAPFEFTGRPLGFGTSRRDNHSHYPRNFAGKGEKCSACRWFEVTLYERVRSDDGAGSDPGGTVSDYVVHTVGGSDVPGEHRLSRVEFTTSAFEVIELLTVRHPGKEPFIAVQSQRALAQAASRDENIRDAYINRAIV